MENEKQEFLVLRNGEGKYLPMAFISRFDESGKMRASKVKLEDKDTIVVVSFKENGIYF